MKSPILCILKLVIRISPKLILDAFYKSSRMARIITGEDLKFCQKNNIIWLFFLNMSAFILCSASVNIVTKKKSCKQGIIVSIGSGYIEMIFALLVEQIVIQMQFLII